MPWKEALHLFVVPNAVEDEHVKWTQAAPRALQDLGRLEALLQGEHPVEGVHGEGEVVLDAEAEEDVLQRRAPGLVRLGERDLSRHSLAHKRNYVHHSGGINEFREVVKNQ